MVEKIVKETFKPDPDEGEAKKGDKVIETKLVEHDTSLPDEESNVAKPNAGDKGSVIWK